MDIGDGERVGQCHDLGIDIGAADDDDLVHAAPQRVAARRGEGRIEAGRDDDAGRGESGSRLTTMVVRPASGLPIERKVLRPMTTGLPMVTARKCCMSDLSRHGSALSRPITPFSATAATRV